MSALSSLFQTLAPGESESVAQVGEEACLRSVTIYSDAVDWQDNLITDVAGIREVLGQTRTVAVLGIKPEAHAAQPAFYVPRYLASVGFEIIPVPVYYPEVTSILGRPVYRTLVEIPIEVDLVDVFRRAADLPRHVEDMVAKGPRVVWLQSGIRHDAVAEQLAKAGIVVVQDRCMMIDHRSLM